MSTVCQTEDTIDQGCERKQKQTAGCCYTIQPIYKVPEKHEILALSSSTGQDRSILNPNVLKNVLHLMSRCYPSHASPLVTVSVRRM